MAAFNNIKLLFSFFNLQYLFMQDFELVNSVKIKALLSFFFCTFVFCIFTTVIFCVAL